MAPLVKACQGLMVALLVSGAWAMPQATYKSNTVDLVPTNAPDPGPPGASGSIRGPKSLNGYAPDHSNDPILDTVIPPSQFQLAPGQSADPDLGFYLDLEAVNNPQPIRGGKTAPTDPGPRTEEYEKLNSDLFAPPGTDQGSVSQAKWPLGLSHNRHGLNNSGWARQQNTEQLPAASAMAGVDMRLEPNAYRELHWHKASEWALMLRGNVRIVATTPNGELFIDDLEEGDVWFFPPGIPHSIQAGSGGCEFLLVFDQGDFSEDNTFLLSDFMLRNPKSVLAKDFRTDVSAFDNIPDGELYIFPGTPYPTNITQQNSTGPAGPISMSATYSYHFSKQNPLTVPGGSVKILDPETFPIAENFAVALVTIHPGAMREMHWHLTSDEWNYFLQGQARITVFSAPSSSNTFDFNAGDVGYIPVPEPHYIENTGTEDVIVLEVLQAPQFEDISVAQWLGLTPKQIVEDHLHLPQNVVNNLPKVKPYILPGNTNLTTTNFTGEAL